MSPAMRRFVDRSRARSAGAFVAQTVILVAMPWARADERVVMSFLRFSPDPPHRITAIDQGRGEAVVERQADVPGVLAVTEGPALLFVATGNGGVDRAVRVEVAEILDGEPPGSPFPARRPIS